MELELPPWKIFTKAISLIWEKRVFALFISLPFILLYAGAGIATDMGFIDYPTPEIAREQALERLSYAQIARGVATYAVLGFLLSVIAVFWHRSILLGEHSTGSIPLRFDGVVWRYILYAVGLYLITVLLFMTMSLLIATPLVFMRGSGAGIALALFLIPLLILLAVIVFRLSLALPAAAIGRRKFGFRGAWRTSRGHGWQLVAIVLLMFSISIAIALVLAVAFFVVGMPIIVFYASLPKSLTLTGEAILYVAQTLISIGVLSLSFAYLTYEGPRAGPVARR